MWINLVCLITLGLFGCQTPVTAPTPFKSAFPNKAWQEYAYSKLVGMPEVSDGKEFCPQGMNRRNWVHLLAAMAYYESSYNPNAEYKESFRDQHGVNVISTGLFQVSVESSRGYGFRVVQDQLKYPEMNFDIAIAILKKWAINDGVIANHSGRIWRGGARFWSVLRTTGKLDKVKQRMRPWCE